MKKTIFFSIASLSSFVILILIAASLFFASCSKDGKKDNNENENPCPIIAATAVPQVVKDSFSIRYPLMTVDTWFKKDSIRFCAYFIQLGNQKKLAEFAKNGAFIMEEIDLNGDGNFEDSTGHSDPKFSSICECEIPEGK
jgi:hypothetical protein